MKAHGMTYRPDMRRAHRLGEKTETRRLVKATNSHVLPGTFEGVDLDTGRARAAQHVTEIRAQCRFASGNRVVTVLPRIQPGDLLWERASRHGTRAASRMTLPVLEVHGRRVQDMHDGDALAEGVMLLPVSWRKKGRPRDWYARLWDEINGRGSWAANPWVWVIRYRLEPVNIRTYIEGARALEELA